MRGGPGANVARADTAAWNGREGRAGRQEPCLGVGLAGRKVGEPPLRRPSSVGAGNSLKNSPVRLACFAPFCHRYLRFKEQEGNRYLYFSRVFSMINRMVGRKFLIGLELYNAFKNRAKHLKISVSEFVRALMFAATKLSDEKNIQVIEVYRQSLNTRDGNKEDD